MTLTAIHDLLVAVSILPMEKWQQDRQSLSAFSPRRVRWEVEVRPLLDLPVRIAVWHDDRETHLFLLEMDGSILLDLREGHLGQADAELLRTTWHRIVLHRQDPTTKRRSRDAIATVIRTLGSTPGPHLLEPSE